jgi:hypothetical protein
MRSYTVVLACLVAVLSGATRISGQRATTEKHVFVGVANGRGEAVAGLTPADFVVREDDVAREVLRVSPTAPPSHVALLVDNTDQAGGLLIELRGSLLKFMQSMTALAAPPSMSVVTFAERPTVAVPWTTSDIVLERGIQRIFQRPGSGAYLLDAVMETCQGLRRLKAERPVIVAFTMDASPAFSDILHTRVADGLKEAGASLWTIQLLRTGGPGSSEERERARLIGDVTGWSGGTNTPVLSREGLEKGFAAVSSAIVGRYDVVYGRPEALIPPSRMTVETRNRELRVSAPRWPRQ